MERQRLVGSSLLFPSLLRHWTSSCYGLLAVTPIEPLPEGTDLNNLRNSGTWSLQGGMLSLANAWRKNRGSPDKGDKGIPHRGKEMWKVLKAKRGLKQMRIYRVAGGKRAVGVMRLERLTGSRENLVGHRKELRLCPKEHSSHRNVLKQGKVGRLLTTRWSCVTEEALNWESGHLDPCPLSANGPVIFLLSFLICKMGRNACLTSFMGEHWGKLTLRGWAENSRQSQNKAELDSNTNTREPLSW